MSAKDRPFTRLATLVTRGPEGLKALDEGRCPTCGGQIGEFRDELSKKEFQISGMCQSCQDSVFKSEGDDE